MSLRIVCGLVLVASLAGCKSREEAESSVKDATTPVPPCTDTVDYVETVGFGYQTAMYANQGQGKLEMKKLDKMTWDVCSSSGNASVHDFRGGFSGLDVTIDGFKLVMAKNPATNWGYINNGVKCGSVGKLFGITFDSTQADKTCTVQFDTEDQSWYAATITPEWMLSELGYDENADAANKVFLDQVMKKQVADGAGSSMDKPLNPRQINANVDPRVLIAMDKLHKKYQVLALT